MAWVWIVLIGLVAGPIIGGLFHTNRVVNKFAGLGDIVGTPVQQIIARVGPPTSISAMPDGTLYQRQKIIGASGYYYAILVDAHGNAVGFTHQSVQ